MVAVKSCCKSTGTVELDFSFASSMEKGVHSGQTERFVALRPLSSSQIEKGGPHFFGIVSVGTGEYASQSGKPKCTVQPDDN